MKYKILVVLFFLILFLPIEIFAQSYFNGRFRKNNYSYSGINFTVYQFSRKSSSYSNRRIKAKYFARNAYNKFESWRSGKQILIACAGAFSDTWEVDARPHGLCIDNGDIVNRNLHIGMDGHGNSLDGLVIVYNGGADAGGIAIKDIKNGEVCADQCYDIKDSRDDKYNFINWAKNNIGTVFQLPLMYTAEYGKNYGSLYYGEQKERRFLAICKGNDNNIYHLVIDVPQSTYMNYAADKIKDWLYNNGFTRIYGLLVLDTGGKNILYEYMEWLPIKIANIEISNATNLLIYYDN